MPFNAAWFDELRGLSEDQLRETRELGIDGYVPHVGELRRDGQVTSRFLDETLLASWRDRPSVLVPAGQRPMKRLLYCAHLFTLVLKVQEKQFLPFPLILEAKVPSSLHKLEELHSPCLDLLRSPRNIVRDFDLRMGTVRITVPDFLSIVILGALFVVKAVVLE